MQYQLAQLNLAKFHLPKEHPNNLGFMHNLDRINAIAESQPGFVWRLIGEGDDATDIQAFSDPNIIVNMSVWADQESLFNFVYKNAAHKDVMRSRKDWFAKMQFHIVLWWVEEGHRPSIQEAKNRLKLLTENGPTAEAFTFATQLGLSKQK